MKFFFDIFDVVMILQLAVISISLVWVFRHLKFELKPVLRGILHVIIIFAIGTILNYGLFNLAENVPVLRGINFPLAWLITIILYIAFFSNISRNSRIIMGATLYVSVVTMTELGHYGSMLLVTTTGIKILEWVVYVLEYIFILAFAIFIKKFSLSKYTDIPVISAVLILINTIVMSALVFINTEFMMLNIDTSYNLYCIILIVEYIMVITGYLMIWFHCKVRQEITELEVSNRLLESDRKTLMISERALEDMRCMRHDIKNQYTIIKMLLDDKKYTELNEYFSSMNVSEIISRGPKLIDCGNELLNSIINMEMMKAESCGVDLTAKITVDGYINIEKSDLCRIIVNLVDNAIEAVDRNSAHDRPVDCKISKTPDYLYICVRNGLGKMKDKSKALDFVTSKQSPAFHGYGHRIVAKLVDKYHGHIKYSIEEDEFVAEAMLGYCIDDEIL